MKGNIIYALYKRHMITTTFYSLVMPDGRHGRRCQIVFLNRKVGEYLNSMDHYL